MNINAYNAEIMICIVYIYKLIMFEDGLYAIRYRIPVYFA